MITNTTSDCTHSLAQCSDMPWCIKWIFGFINRLYREARCAHWCGGTSGWQQYSRNISGKQKHSHSSLKDPTRSCHVRFSGLCPSVSPNSVRAAKCSEFFWELQRYDISDNACECFDFPTVGENITRSRRVVSQEERKIHVSMVTVWRMRRRRVKE